MLYLNSFLFTLFAPIPVRNVEDKKSYPIMHLLSAESISVFRYGRWTIMVSVSFSDFFNRDNFLVLRISEILRDTETNRQWVNFKFFNVFVYVYSAGATKMIQTTTYKKLVPYQTQESSVPNGLGLNA